MSHNFQSIPCPLCGEVQFRFCFTKKDRDFYRCPKCGIRKQWPLPTLQQLADYYEQAYAEGMYTDFVAADEMKRMTARQRLKEIQRRVTPQGRWLDVGCANGVFVETIDSAGVDAEGIELSENAVAKGRQRGLDLQVGTIDDIPANERFDGVTAFDVLEHVLDPNAFLQSIYDRLADGGYLVITVPNTGGMVRRLMGKRWYFFIPEEHLHYFNRSNLTALVEQHGFDVVNVGATYKPMTYDYSLTQFREYNPLIYRVLKGVSYVVPSALRRKPVPLPIGEIRLIARK